jgi:NADPH-dependent 2,4-dienoyl-CoA reductase/sulfur reductase-like enzyme
MHGELGGQARLAGRLPHRAGWAKLVGELSRRLLQSGATVEVNVALTLDQLEHLAPDVLICATGAQTEAPRPQGPSVVEGLDAMSVLERGRKLPGRVLVVGATRIGIGVAEWLADAGNEVMVVETGPTLGPDVERGTLQALKERLARLRQIEVQLNHELRRLEGDTATLVRPGAFGDLDLIEVPGVRSVVYADRRRSRHSLAAVARDSGLASEVYEIGDGVEPRSAWEAMVEATEVGGRI